MRIKRAGRKKRNPDAAADAAELFERFHGKPSTGVKTYDVPNAAPTDLADLGKLIELSVWLDEDYLIDLAPTGDMRVACVPVRQGGELFGSQIYFVGGDGSIDLTGIDDGTRKEHVMIGPCKFIAYHTSKDFHDFVPSDYEHQFGEDSGELPFLGYDTRNKRPYLIGGVYRVFRPGIVN
jgi:hypothetical protein